MKYAVSFRTSVFGWSETLPRFKTKTEAVAWASKAVTTSVIQQAIVIRVKDSQQVAWFRG
jgi:hypothetical protein